MDGLWLSRYVEALAAEDHRVREGARPLRHKNQERRKNRDVRTNKNCQFVFHSIAPPKGAMTNPPSLTKFPARGWKRSRQALDGVGESSLRQ
jgi:hypothetical protein